MLIPLGVGFLVLEKQMYNSTKYNKASEMTNNYTNINWWLIGLIILLAGMAIPTRSQNRQIKELKESLEYERARTNITVEASAERQKARQTQTTE